MERRKGEHIMVDKNNQQLEEKANSKRMNIVKISLFIGFVFAFYWGVNGALIDFIPSVIVLIVFLGVEIFDSYRKSQKNRKKE